MTRKRALVLGGGGLAGIAWHTGMLHGLAQAGLAVTAVDLVVGTSAGATVAVQTGSAIPLPTWYQRQVDPSAQNAELLPVGTSTVELWATMIRLLEKYPDPAERRRQVGAIALAADTVPESTRRAVVAGRLSGVGWPDRRTLIVAAEATSGERVVLAADSGVDVVDAVAASSAVPGVWPPVTVGDTRYIDGGTYSLCNADLADGHDRVLVLAPMADGDLAAQIEVLGGHRRARAVSPDEEAVRAFGADPLDPAVRAPAAEAGLAQGQRSAPELAAWWNR